MTYLITVPNTRVNDSWFEDVQINQSNIKHPLITDDENDTLLQPKFYKNFCVDIVSETVFDYPYPYITEKTLRPIACKRFFIVIGAAGVLELLKSKGFDTFPDLIDGSYDTITDPRERWKKLTEVISEIITRPLEDLKRLLIDNEHRLDQNLRTLSELETKEIECLRSKR